MKKYILALASSLIMGVSISATTVEARPTSAQAQTASEGQKPAVKKAKKPVKKAKKTKKRTKQVKKPVQQQQRQAVKVETAKNPFIKCQFLFWEVDCPNPEYKEPVQANRVAHNTAQETKRAFVGNSSRIIANAQQYVGLHAKENRQTVKAIISKPFDRPIDPARIPWCAACANAILRENNYDTTDSLMARSFLNYGVPTRTPTEGDIVVLTRGRSSYTGHVGFYVYSVTIDGQNYVAVLGGNQGKAINVAYYPASRVLGYRKPVARVG